jgi:N-methylhydantoinase B/oxoprolinase/acetone carboxylase alpha subunit
LQRASYSPNIKLRRDFSCAIFDAQGRLLAQAAHIPVHLGAMPLAMRAVLDHFELRPGDVVIMNDPFTGGTHLPDISLISASFSADGETHGYVMSRAHHADVGGMSPGSMPLSTEIYQEGIVIPPTLLTERGILNRGVWDVVLANVRTPEERQGDLSAQLAAQRVGGERLAGLAEKYNTSTLVEHGEALQRYSERMMRSLISRFAPGEYRYTDFLDDDGQSTDSVPITVCVRRAAGSTELEIDFTGSAPQQAGSVNAVTAVTISAALYVMRCLEGEDVPVNAGSLAPLRIIVPEGSVVGATKPAAVAGGNVETSQRIVDVLFGAFAQCVPYLSPAASQGTMNNLTMGSHAAGADSTFAYYETMGGGMGARPSQAGMSGVHDHMSNTLNTPIEALESSYPLRVVRYEIRRGTGGSGLHSGGEGLRRDLQFLSPTRVTILAERRRLAPYGLQGGQAGAIGANVLIRGGREQSLAGKVQFDAAPGDILSLRSPGGGGHGLSIPPGERR